MKCPNCAVEQPNTNQECPGCQINFAKYNEALYKRQQSAAQAPPSAAPAADEGGVSPWVFALGGALVCGAVFLALSPKKGLPVPDGAYRDEKFKFALSPIKDWKLETGGKAEGKMNQALAMTKPGGEGESALVMTIAVVSEELPPITEKTKAEAVAEINVVLKKMFDDFKVESDEVVMVDNLSSLKVVAVSKKTIEISPAVYANPYGGPYRGGPLKVLARAAETRTFELKTLFYLVPGAKRGYFIAALAETDRYAAVAKDLEAAFDSFRVLERPWPHGRVLGYLFGELNRSLSTSLAIALALGFFRWLFGR